MAEHLQELLLRGPMTVPEVPPTPTPKEIQRWESEGGKTPAIPKRPETPEEWYQAEHGLWSGPETPKPWAHERLQKLADKLNTLRSVDSFLSSQLHDVRKEMVSVTGEISDILHQLHPTPVQRISDASLPTNRRPIRPYSVS